jgi:RNA polymerase sigma-70 factor (ECF subfamily)
LPAAPGGSLDGGKCEFREFWPSRSVSSATDRDDPGFRPLNGYDVSADACAEMERHVAGCDQCRGACDSLRQVLGMCRAAPADVPEAVQRSVQRAIRDLLEHAP